MALTTLSAVKTALTIASANTTEDGALTQWIAGASFAIREHCSKYLYGLIGAISVANPAAITSPGHGLETGNVISIVGSNSTPSVDGTQTVTVVDMNTFTIPVNVTIVGTSGQFARSCTEFYSGTGSQELLLKQRPVQSITNIWEDQIGYMGEPAGAFATSTLLVAGTDYVLHRDNAGESDVSKTGRVWRINSIWRRPTQRISGLLTLSAGDAKGNYKVQYIAGLTRALPNVQLACNQFVTQLRKSAATGAGGPMKSEAYDYYRYERDADLECACLDSVKGLLKKQKQWNL